jgi:hypothetical protein
LSPCRGCKSSRYDGWSLALLTEDVLSSLRLGEAVSAGWRKSHAALVVKKQVSLDCDRRKRRRFLEGTGAFEPTIALIDSSN